jgi:hypothetical protein
MSYTLSDNLSASLALQVNQPLRATFRRSATATAQEFFSAGLRDTSMGGLTAKLDEKLPGKSFVRRVSPWTYGDEIATCDLVVTGSVPADFNPSQSAYELDRLLAGFPLVRLEGRARVAGEENRADQRDDANKVAQGEADKQTWQDKIDKLLDTLGDIGKVAVVVGVLALIFLYAPRPAKPREEKAPE